ncbi:MAG TPA: RICIN domain-containing protein, partial [Longimicrobium sp.]
RQSDGHKITAAHSGNALDVGGGSTAEGANVITWLGAASDRQKWDVVDVGGEYYRITAKHSGKSLDVASCSTANGADAIVRTYTGADCQRWRIETAP